MAGRTRFFIRSDGAVNEEKYADLSKDFVHVTGSNLGEDSIRQIKVDALDGSFMNLLQAKVEELKETSGNRDFSQGGTSSGVTAAFRHRRAAGGGQQAQPGHDQGQLPGFSAGELPVHRADPAVL